MTVALVTGATGAVGPTLVRHLIASGYGVRAISRKLPPSGLLPANVDYYQGDITDGALLARAMDGVSIVFHLAALLHIINPSSSLTPEYYRINVDGAKLVAERAQRAGVRRLVYFSTVKVYGAHERQPVTEDHPKSPTTAYAKSKLLGEQVIHATTNIETVAIRLSPVYGPSMKGSWQRMLRAIRRGWFLPVGDLKNVHSLTNVMDVAAAAQFVAEHPGVNRQTYNVVGHELPTMREILSALYAACGRSLPSLHIPSWLALAGVGGAEAAMNLVGKQSPLPVEAIRQLIIDEAYSAATLRQLGFSPKVKLTDGWTTATL